MKNKLDWYKITAIIVMIVSVIVLVINIFDLID